jgi:hypothetical protein
MNKEQLQTAIYGRINRLDYSDRLLICAGSTVIGFLIFLLGVNTDDFSYYDYLFIPLFVLFLSGMSFGLVTLTIVKKKTRNDCPLCHHTIWGDISNLTDHLINKHTDDGPLLVTYKIHAHEKTTAPTVHYFLNQATP